MFGWISVTERLPKTTKKDHHISDECMVFCAGIKLAKYHLYLEPTDTGIIIPDIEKTGWYHHDLKLKTPVTHWMSLPPAPII